MVFGVRICLGITRLPDFKFPREDRLVLDSDIRCDAQWINRFWASGFRLVLWGIRSRAVGCPERFRISHASGIQLLFTVGTASGLLL